MLSDVNLHYLTWLATVKMSRVFTDRCNRLAPKKADVLLFIKHNLALINFKYWGLSVSNGEKIGVKLFSFPPLPSKSPRQIPRFWRIRSHKGTLPKTLKVWSNSDDRFSSYSVKHMLFEWLCMWQGTKTLDGVGYVDGYSFCITGTLCVKISDKTMGRPNWLKLKELRTDITVFDIKLYW